jgi:hypothetical protein
VEVGGKAAVVLIWVEKELSEALDGMRWVGREEGCESAGYGVEEGEYLWREIAWRGRGWWWGILLVGRLGRFLAGIFRRSGGILCWL